jgi:hypothetical protein
MNLETVIILLQKCRSGEMADAHDSGSCIRKDVEVQLLSPAQSNNQLAFNLCGGFPIRFALSGSVFRKLFFYLSVKTGNGKPNNSSFQRSGF